MDTAKVDPAKGPVSAEVKCGFAQPGSYTLMLWEANENTIVMEKKGNFKNTDDDEYELPAGASSNVGRLLDCIISVVVTPPLKDYAMQLIVRQDGAEIGRTEVSGKVSSDQIATVNQELFVELTS